MSLIWLTITIVAIVVDIFTSIFLFSGFSIGALISLIMNLCGVPIDIQVITFSVIGILFILIASPKIRKSISKNRNKVVTISDKLIGLEVKAEKDIDDEAVVFIDGAYWTVKNSGEAIRMGEQIKIISIKGNKLIIQK